jgi:predicted permease
MSTLLRRLLGWARHGRVEADLSAELEFHRAAIQDALERDGLSRRDAEAASRRAMGNMTLAREDARRVWLAAWLESVWQDVSYAVRALRRQPGFTLVALGALTAGIGLNASLFTVYTALAIKPWAAAEPEQIVRVLNQSAYDLRKRAGGGPGGFSRAEVDYFRRHARTVAGFTLTGRTLTVRVGDADVPAHWVDANYFSLLGVAMALGRGFDPAGRVEQPRVEAVLSHGYWQRQFGGDAGIVGREIRFDDVPFTVTGVAPARFPGTLPERIDIWLPLSSAPVLRPDDRWVRGVLMPPANCCTPLAARLAPGVAAEQAASELNALSRQFRGERPGDHGGLRVAGTQVFADARSGDGVFVPLFIALVLVLLLACANVGNLLLARAAARRREIAVRLSLGASRWRIVRQLLTESLVLACAAGAAGIAVASWLPAQIVALAAGRPTALRLEPDLRVLAFTCAICGLSCVLFGLAPALQGTRGGTMGAIKEGPALPGARFTLRTMLLAVQVAAVVVLLAAAGVLIRSARAASDRVLAGPARTLSVVSIAAPVRGYDAARIRALAMEIEQALQPAAASGAVALTSTPPLASGNIKGAFRIAGIDEDHYNAVFEVSPSYFTLMGLAIVDGRGFEPGDRGRAVIVINETMARRHWPRRSAVGQRIVCTPPESGWNMPGELEIVGVARDAFMTSLQDVEPTIFQPPSYRTLPGVLADGRAAADAAVAAAARIDPRLRVRVDPLAAAVTPRLHSARVGAIIAGSLGVLALVFACVGMFGVFAYWVRQRTQEIGVRMALGAQSSDVIRLVLGTTARAVAIGLAAGVAGSIAGARLLRAYLFGLSGIDPATYAAVALLLVVASLAAAYVPARRATRIDPLVALRHE